MSAAMPVGTIATRRGAWAIAVLLVFFVAMSLWFATSNSQTYDEPSYLYSGYSHLNGDFAINWHHPPLSKELAALPVYALARLHLIAPPAFTPRDQSDDDPVGKFLYRSPLPFSTMLLMGRLPMLLLGVLTVLVVARWAGRLWGVPAAVLATALAVTEPTFVAHSNLATPDIAVTCFLTLFFYVAWEYAQVPSWPRLVLAGLALGAALGSKFTALGALPAMMAGACIVGWPFPWRTARVGIRPSPVESTIVAALVASIAVVVLAACYGFTGFESWRQGFSGQVTHVAHGHPAFFLGEYSTAGWSVYFPVAFALKTPLPTFVAIATSLVLVAAGGLDRRTVLWLIVPMLCLLAPMMWGGVDIGIRYVLPLYPLFFVLTSRLAALPALRSRLASGLFAGALAWNVFAMLTVAPHFLAAASPLAGGPAGLARYLSDSNIDWGQDIGNLKRYLDREGIASLYLSYFGTGLPSDYGIHYQYLPSNFFSDVRRDVVPADARDIVAVSVTNLQGVYLADHELYAWLRERRPIAMIGWSIYVYDLTGEPGLHCRFANLYTAAGEPAYAAHEQRRCTTGR